VAASGAAAASQAAPIRYVAAVFGATDPEIANPLVIALTHPPGVAALVLITAILGGA
jgi:hypothetical protein